MKKLFLLTTFFLLAINLCGQKISVNTINSDNIRGIITDDITLFRAGKFNSISCSFIVTCGNDKGLKDALITMRLRFDGALNESINAKQYLLIKLNDNSIIKLICEQGDQYREGYVVIPQYIIDYADLEKIATIGVKKIRVFTGRIHYDFNTIVNIEIKKIFDMLEQILSIPYDIEAGF